MSTTITGTAMAEAPSKRERRATFALLGAVVAVMIAGALSASRRSAGAGVPGRAAHAEDVVAKVRARGRDPQARQLEGLRAALLRAPRDEGRAVELARSLIERSRETGDPRELGRAEAALSPWWEMAAPPAAIWLLRATIRQSRHDFGGALADLDGLLLVDRQNAQAWLTRAVVLGVEGRYEDALTSCGALAESNSLLTLAACRAPLLATTGRTGEAELALAAVIPAATSVGARAWIHALVGEIAAWQGDEKRAEEHLRVALGLDPTDRYVRAALADLWLDENRCDEVTALLEGRTQDDGALLRLALAARCQKGKTAGETEGRAEDKTARALATDLRERFAAARARGESLHGREESRALLGLEGDAARALALAAGNWKVQREPADARVFLEAAFAAKARAAAAPVLAWVATTGFEGKRVRALAAAVEALP